MNIILYSTGCPKCNVLTKKLKSKDVEFSVVNDIETMRNLGISEVPVLSLDEKLLSFKEAVDWLNTL